MVTRFIVVIILYCLEILNYYAVYQKQTHSCRSTMLQKQTKSKKKRSDLRLPEAGVRRGGFG